MEKVILHCDMNSFYASVELIDKPELRNLPVAVGGSSSDRHGIILAKTKEAKVCGVKTGEPIWQARNKCKNLIVLPPNYEKYLYYSKKAHEIYYKYTNQVEPYGMDECWLDISGSQKLFGDSIEIANKIKDEIKNRLYLTISVGISFNKVFAKLGSDMADIDDVKYISKDNYKFSIWNLPCSYLIMVGRETTKKLNRYGIDTIGDLAKTDPLFLKKLLGVNGIKIWNWANGQDLSSVEDYFYLSPIKSFGRGITCKEDLINIKEVRNVYQELVQKISKRLIENDLLACSIQISFKYSSLDVKSCQCKLNYPTFSSLELTEYAMYLFNENCNWKKNIRALSIRVTDLISKDKNYQTNLFNNIEDHEKKLKIEKSINGIRDKFGYEAITYASLMENYKMPKDNREIIIMPNNFK